MGRRRLPETPVPKKLKLVRHSTENDTASTRRKTPETTENRRNSIGAKPNKKQLTGSRDIKNEMEKLVATIKPTTPDDKQCIDTLKKLLKTELKDGETLEPLKTRLRNGTSVVYMIMAWIEHVKKSKKQGIFDT